MNFYEILNIPKTASKSEIKKAYYLMAKKYHPDINKAPDATEKFKKINDAYHVLYDDQLKFQYDNSLKNNYQFKNDVNNWKVTQFNKFMEEEFTISEIDSYLKSLNMNELIHTYYYFWLSFWANGDFTSSLLKNRMSAKIFLAFAKMSNINAFINNIKKTFSSSQKQKFQGNINNFGQTIQQINYSFTNANNKKSYNRMVQLINNNNLFDSEEIALISIMPKYVNEIELLFTSFENLYNHHNKKGIFNKKPAILKKKWTGVQILVVLIIIVVLVVVFTRK